MITLAYIGPGAGFAFVGAFLMLLAAVAASLLSLLTWPLRLVAARLLRRRPAHRPDFQRVVILGLDGVDPRDIRRLIDAGRLPAFARLEQTGAFVELATTCPPISPVAWSSFMTGANPGKHNIFDFLSRDPRRYSLRLSSSCIEPYRTRGFKRRGMEPRGLRKSQPFWHVLGEYGVPATVLRVPLTYPPERFRGRCLSGMCVPDLRGTQGEFTVFESDVDDSAPATGGRRIPVVAHDSRIDTALPGPPLGGASLDLPLRITLRPPDATLTIDGRTVALPAGRYTPWIALTFRRGLTRIHGICRFLLLSAGPRFRLYVTPLNIDPRRPALPISHPAYYAVYLARLHGPFATLGLAEDTWALNEKVIDHAAFRQQAYDIHDERERMFMDALARTRHGLCACVFDLPDRIQHVFRREPRDGAPLTDADTAMQTEVDGMCVAMDGLVQRTLDAIDDDTLLIVMSDHGFGDFHSGVNLNAWLREEGYLAIRGDAADPDYLAAVDWPRTRAYAFGLAGLTINLRGRERDGVVAPGAECDALKTELAAKLAALRDPRNAARAVHRVYDAAAVYTGPYAAGGPDLIVGYANGYRASWQCATGRTDGAIFAPNTKAWQADHCIDRELVPGILLSNTRLQWDAAPHIMDIGPTVLRVFGIDAPGYMDGKAMRVQGAKSRAAGATRAMRSEPPTSTS